MARKKKDYVPLLIRLEKKNLKWIRSLAFSKGISISEMIRRIIDHFSDNQS